MSRLRLPHKVAREMDRDLRRVGFVLGYSGRGHIVWRRGEQTIRAPSSPSDWDEVRKKVMAQAQKRS